MTDEGNRGRRNYRHGGAGTSRDDGGRDRPVPRDGTGVRTADRVSGGTIESSQLGAEGLGRPAGGTGETAAAVTHQVRVETGTVAATLVGIPRVDLREVAYEHGIDRERLESGETDQPVALFDLHNTSGVPIQWTSSRTRFIGDDGYTYSPAQLSLDPSALGPGTHTRRVEIQPDRRARIATPVERVPAGVEIVEVVQTLPIRAGSTETEQLVFTIAE